MSVRSQRPGTSLPAPILAVLALCAVAALWISDGVGLWDTDVNSSWHHYEYLAEGFAQGHTYLSVTPEPELLALKDPYDPSANTGHRLWDASLYGGRYYLYFGPTPALLMLPWRLATGHEPSQRMVVVVSAVAELAAIALLLEDLRRRFFTRLSPAGLGTILIVAFHASWLPVLLRRSAVWEVPITAAVACLAWAIFFLWRFHASQGKLRWAVAGGTALALLIGCRVTFLFPAAVVLLLFFLPTASGRPSARMLGTAGIAALIVAAGGLALLAYNHERFGRWAEFGQNFMLTGNDYRDRQSFSPRFIAFNVWTYVFSTPELGPYFPFLHPFWSAHPPAGYTATEDTYGILFMMPVHLTGFAACAWAWRNRKDAASRPAAIAVAAAAGSSVLSALLLFSFLGSCSRYTAELLDGWTLATSVGLMAVFGGAEGQRPRRLVRTCTALAAAWTVACVGLASAEYRGYMKQANPRAYSALAHLLDYPAAWRARSTGVRYGPLDMVIRMPPASSDSRTVLLASGRPNRVNFLLLDRTPGGESRLILAVNEHHVLQTPPIRVPGPTLHIRVDAPWLYPPPESPYWDGVADPAVRGDLQSLFALTWDAGGVRINSAHFADPVAFEPTVLDASQAGPDSPAVVSLQSAAPER